MNREKLEQSEKEDFPDFEEKIGLKRKSNSVVFLYLRYAGWLFIAVSAFFLLQRSKPPLVVLGNTALDNESLGELLLLIGIILFGSYLANRIYSYFKS